MTHGTCGHKLHDLDKGKFGIPVKVKEYDGEGKRAIAYLFVCPKCAEWYEDKVELIHGEDEEKEWLAPK